MKIMTAFAFLMVLPSLAVAQQLSEERLIELAIEQGVCGELSPISARYDDEGTPRVTCGEATGFLPAVGAIGLGGGAAAAAAGIALLGVAGGGGGGSTPSTN